MTELAVSSSEVATAITALAPACEHEVCITCGDVALPLTVVRVDGQRGLAFCTDEEGGSETVEIDLVAPVAPGHRILVHAGTAIAHLGEARMTSPVPVDGVDRA